MAVSYSYEADATTGPAAIVAVIRRTLGDTEVAGMSDTTPRSQRTAMWSDQELLGFSNDVGGDPVYAAARALRAKAAYYAARAISASFGGAGGNVDFQALSTQLSAMADNMEAAYRLLPAEQIVEIDSGPTAANRIIWNSFLRQTP